MPDFIVGLDLGQSSDPTALAVLKRSLAIDPAGLPVRNDRGDTLYRFDCVHLHRFTLGTPYPAIVTEVAKLLASPRLGGSPRLAIDATGVGRPVVDMFLAGRPEGHWCYPVTITASVVGSEARLAGWGHAECVGYWVPKIELVSAVQAGLQSGRLKVVPTLKLADTLKKELLGFQVKVTASANETFGAWREGAHDDLVLAVAMAAWLGQRREIRYHEDGDVIEQVASVPTAPLPSDKGQAALVAERRKELAAVQVDAAKSQEQIEREHHDISNPLWWT